MNKSKKIIASSTLIVCSIFVVNHIIQWEYQIQFLMDRYPEYDYKVIRRAYRQMVFNTLRGVYNIKDVNSEDELDAIFHNEVQQLASK